MSEINNYKGYEFKIESIIDTNSPYSDITDLNKFWYKSIIIPPKDKKERCLNVEFHNISFIVKYVDDNVFPTSKNVKCDISVLKEKGCITLEIKDKELNKRDYILEDLSRQLIDYIENVLDSKEDYASSNVSNNNLIKMDKTGNLCMCANNNNLTPTPEFQKLLLKQIVNSDNPLKEIERISELINTIKNYFE